ncbi:MAG: VanZ family protein [Catonella sp.]
MKKFVDKNKKLIVSLIFIMYLLVLGYHLFLSDILGRREIAEGYRYNFVLFKEIIRYITNMEAIGFKLVLLNLGGNIIAFIPLGTFMSYFFNGSRHTFIKTILIGLILTTLVEGIQLVTRVGICDVDDILLNFTGVVTGAVLAKLFRKKNKST